MFGGKMALGLGDSKILYIGELDSWMNEAFLKNIFSQISKCSNINVVLKGANNFMVLIKTINSGMMSNVSLLITTS